MKRLLSLVISAAILPVLPLQAGTKPSASPLNTPADTLPPVMETVLPLTNSVVRSLYQIEVLFSELVTNMDAGDLLINGFAATDMEFGAPGQFLFTFPQPLTGTVQVAWASGHGIHDLAPAPNAFAGGSWTYVLNPSLGLFDVRINEFMADNENGIRDEDGSYEDWIELYNAGATTVNLAGCFLTDSSSDLPRWRFPAGLTMGPNSYLLVWASQKDRTNLASLHTNFKLEKNGEYLGFVLPDSNTVVSSFAPTYPAQSANISYGRDRLDPSILGFYSPPTPRQANTNSASSAVTAEVRFSRPSGTFVDNFLLKLSTPTTNAVIRYVVLTNATQALSSTTNVPTTSSPIYTNPIPINGTTIVRTRAFTPGLLPSEPKTENYIQIDQNVAQFSSDLPVVILHNMAAGTPPQRTPQQTAILMSFETNNGRASLSAAPSLATRVGEHLRGSSTINNAKWNLSVEFWDDYNQDADKPFLDMPAESDWVFFGINQFDPGLMHNKIYQWLGDVIGVPASRTRYAEVFIKSDAGALTTNDYYGLYLIEEKTKISKNRLDLPGLQVEDTNAPAITGGYLMKIDRNQAPSDRSFRPPQIGTVRPTPEDVVFSDPGYSPSESDPRRLMQINYMQNYVLNFITNLASASYTNPVTGYAQYIDTDQWVDHLIANIFPFNVDGYRLSGYFFKDRNGRLQQGPQWDCDRCLGTGGSGPTPDGDNRCFSPRYWRLPTTGIGTDNGTDFFGLSTVGVSWFERLFRDPDFWQKFIDRYQTYRTNQYSTNVMFGKIDEWHQEIKEAQVREQLRWGGMWRGGMQSFTYPRSGPQSVNGYSFDFGGATNQGRGAYLSEVKFQKKWLEDRMDFMDTNFLAMPRLSTGTKLLPSGTTVTVTPAAKANTRLYYTLDGTDPRLPGGAISPSAFTVASGPLTLTITNNVHLFVRCYNTSHANLTNYTVSPGATNVGNPLINSFWSGPAAATYYTAEPTLRITEVMYNPPKPPAGNTNDAGNYEYVELKNTGASALNLAGFSLSGGINLTFTNVVLGAGQYCVAVKSTPAFLSRYGVGTLIAGEYAGNLANEGDHIVLTGPLGEPIHDFNYGGGWYALADGGGFSLSLVNENTASTNYSTNVSWRISAIDKGSPGQLDPVPSRPPLVVINEAITHADPGVGDAIELINTGATNASIGYWYLTDEFDTPRKYQIPAGIEIVAGGFALFHELTSFGGANGFGLSSKGDKVYVFSGDAAGNLTGWYHGFNFGAQFRDASFGRHLNSLGGEEFVSQKTNTLGAANAGPRVGPVVIHEVMYHPPDILLPFVAPDDTLNEYIELRNISSQPVALYHPTYSSNTWILRDAVDYTFPRGVVLPAGGFAVVVSFDPAEADTLNAFTSKYSVPAGTPIFGPYLGKLDNSEDSVELAAPDGPSLPPAADAGFVPYVLADKVKYQALMPWNEAADGFGPSLQRIVPGDFGNEPTNWVAARPNPGAPSVIGGLPVVIQQPTNQIVVGTHPATFNVIAGGPGPFSYQWRWNGNSIYGANLESYTLDNSQLANQGFYDCLVMNDAGAIFSTNAILTVLLPANLLVQPSNILVYIPPDTRAAPSSNVTFFVVVTSTNPPISYQWRKGGADITGATTSNLTIFNVGPLVEGYYSCAVKDGIGTIVTSNALLQPLVTPKWRTYGGAAMRLTLTTGAVVRISVELEMGYPLPITFDWRRVTSPAGPIGDDAIHVVSRLADSYDFTNTNAVNANAVNYRVVAKNPALPNGVAQNFGILTVADSDGDGITDAWGTNYFNTIDTAALRDVDSDGDGMSNFREYLAGTDPTNQVSVLRISPLNPAGGVWVEFSAMSNHTYVVESTDNVGALQWNKLKDVTAYPTNRVERVPDATGGTNRFYRVVVP